MDMNEIIRNVVSKVTGSSGSRYIAGRNQNPNPAPLPLESKNNPKGSKQCYHELIELYANPCLMCNTFCNCGHTYFPKCYPDVLVRSVDKRIVQLSGNLVRASSTLSNMVDKFVIDNNSAPIKEDRVIIEREANGHCNSITEYKTVYRKENRPRSESDSSSFNHKRELNDITNKISTLRLRDTAKRFSAYKMEKNKLGDHTCRWEDLIEISKTGGKVLTLFDIDSDRPTFGSSKEVLLKVDYYVNMHLDDVDMRVETKKRSYAFRQTSRYYRTPFSRAFEFETESDLRDVNTFRFEDWEEEFFNVDCGAFFDLHKANQELLVWDLYYAIEKWLFLGRGYPQLMVNGNYDLFSDPDFDKTDKKNVFGLYMVRYPNPYRTSWHLKSRLNISHFNKVNFLPRWWAVSTEQIQGKDATNSY